MAWGSLNVKKLIYSEKSMYENYRSKSDNSQVMELHFKNIMEETLKQSKPSLKRNDFRVSSMPYCPIVAVKNFYSEKPEFLRLQDDFYFKIGSAIHELIQSYKHKITSARVWGDWVCNKCKKTFLHAFEPVKCSCCSEEFYYKEIELKYGPLSGHIDMITYDDSYGWTVWDYKTCGLKYIDNPEHRRKLPHSKNVHQIETYCVLMKILHGIKINQYILCYIARDQDSGYMKNNSWNLKWKYHNCIKKFTKDIFKKRWRFLNLAMQARFWQLQWIKNKDNISAENIIEHRPCKSKSDFEYYGSDVVDIEFGKCRYWDNKKNVCKASKSSLL